MCPVEHNSGISISARIVPDYAQEIAVAESSVIECMKTTDPSPALIHRTTNILEKLRSVEWGLSGSESDSLMSVLQHFLQHTTVTGPLQQARKHARHIQTEILKTSLGRTLGKVTRPVLSEEDQIECPLKRRIEIVVQELRPVTFTPAKLFPLYTKSQPLQDFELPTNMTSMALSYHSSNSSPISFPEKKEENSSTASTTLGIEVVITNPELRKRVCRAVAQVLQSNSFAQIKAQELALLIEKRLRNRDPTMGEQYRNLYKKMIRDIAKLRPEVLSEVKGGETEEQK